MNQSHCDAFTTGNIVKVYDASFHDMIQYIVMEYIDGITSKNILISRALLSERRNPPDRTDFGALQQRSRVRNCTP